MKVATHICTLAVLAFCPLMISGCANEQGDVGTNDNSSSQTVLVDDHSGWWCVEHGIPEEECSMCSASAAREFRDKGDWCTEHNRAESQCFICDPSRAEKYAKLYEAKYGEKPPAIND